MITINIDYSLLPEGLRSGMQQWIEHGILPGRFLTHVLHNRLVDSFGCADDFNGNEMVKIVNFMYNEAPSSCWRTKENIENWIADHKK